MPNYFSFNAQRKSLGTIAEQEKCELSQLAEGLTCLLKVSTGKELESLSREYPFLDELTAASNRERSLEMKYLERVLPEFLANGNVFLWAVERLLLAHRYRDLAAYMATDSTLGPHFLRLLNAALGKYKNKKSPEALEASSCQKVDFDSILSGIRRSQLDGDLLNEIQEAVEERNAMRTLAARTTCYGPIHFQDSEVQAMLRIVDQECSNDSKTPSISTRLRSRLVHAVREIHQDVNASVSGGFVFHDDGYLRVWNHVGENLRQLCYLVGANIQHSTTDSPWIIPALRGTIDSQTGALAVTQGIIQQQSTKIQNQKQVIASLIFRGLMEQIPPPEIERKTATSKWQGFWDKAVKAAEAKDGNSEHPLRGILTSQVKNRGRDLYGTMSFGIHNYSDGAFFVDSTTFTALDSKILKALAPAKTSINDDGTVDWIAERKRYGIE